MTTIKIKPLNIIYDFDIEKKNKKNVEAKYQNYCYKGEIKSGYASGKGTLFLKDNILFEGTWKNGLYLKGKQYDVESDKLLYEGEFKNGQRHGYGEMPYYNGYLDIYKGQFKKGKKNGIGKIYTSDDLTCEGKWKDDKLVYGKEFDYENGKVLYVGNMNGFKDGGPIYHGKGRLYTSDDEYIVGTFKNGMKDGPSKLYAKDGRLKRKGTYKNDKFEGIVTNYWMSGRVKDKLKYMKGQVSGKGKTFYDNEKNSIEYEGNYSKSGRRKGRGKLYYPNGKVKWDGIFDGGFKKGKKYLETGDGYEEGVYDFGERDGYCKIYYKGKLEEKGLWKRGRREGLHYIYHPNGNLRFKVRYINNYREGKGKEYWDNGKLKYDGVFYTGRYEGVGKKYNENGNLAESGTFFMNRLKKGTKYYWDEYIVGTWNHAGMNGKCTEYWTRNKKIKSVGIWKDDKKNGLFSIYYPNGKLEFKGRFEDDKKHGKGIEYNPDGAVRAKGYWKEGNYIGNKKLEKSENKVQIFKRENKIRKFLQDSNLQHLKTIKPKEMKEYLKKYSGKEVKGNRDKLIKELRKWKQQLNRQRVVEGDEPMVFDAYEGGDIPISEFLQEEDRVLLISESGHYFGAYLTQCDVIYECERGRAFYDYVGNPNVHAMIRFPTASASKFYFNIDIDNDMKNGYNVFHFKTEPKDLKVLSKDVAEGGSFVGGLHCDPKDIIKLSTVTKKEKKEGGLKKTVDFEF